MNIEMIHEKKHLQKEATKIQMDTKYSNRNPSVNL